MVIGYYNVYVNWYFCLNYEFNLLKFIVFWEINRIGFS